MDPKQQPAIDQAQTSPLVNGQYAPPVNNTSSLPVVGAVPQLAPIQLEAPVITIGRFPNNMVVLNHPLVSGYHAGWNECAVAGIASLTWEAPITFLSMRAR